MPTTLVPSPGALGQHCARPALWPPVSGLLCLVRRFWAWTGTHGFPRSQSSAPSRARKTGPTTPSSSQTGARGILAVLMIKNHVSCVGRSIHELVFLAPCCMGPKMLRLVLCSVPCSTGVPLPSLTCCLSLDALGSVTQAGLAGSPTPFLEQPPPGNVGKEGWVALLPEPTRTLLFLVPPCPAPSGLVSSAESPPRAPGPQLCRTSSSSPGSSRETAVRRSPFLPLVCPSSFPAPSVGSRTDSALSWRPAATGHGNTARKP